MLTRNTRQRFERIPDTFVHEVLARVDILNVVGAVVPLKKSGVNYFGCCPFHHEKSPSFSVAPDKQFFHCFGCGKNGNAIGFLIEHAGLSFREAVQELAHGVGLALPSQSPDAAAQAAAVSQKVDSILKVNETAWQFFRHCLVHEDKPKAYLKQRQVPAAAANRFLIGYAPPGWQNLKEAFPDYEKNDALIASGLVIRNESGRRYDRFRDRLIFGIRDARGRLIGMGGRELDGSDTKYINSPDSPAFDKSAALFGVYEAREAIRRTGRVIVTEGYIDTIAHSSAGLEESVCTMGTACTWHHIERLMALSKEVIFAFDGDAAGLKAAWRAMETCMPAMDDVHTIRFLLLPDGLDPDELISKEGADAYRQRVDGAMPLSTFLISQLTSRHNGLKTAEDRARFVHDAMAVIGELPYGLRLYRFLRAEVQHASNLSATDIAAMTRASPATSGTHGRGTWAALESAVREQPATATEHADQAIEQLAPELQDSFFAMEWGKFSHEQRGFWSALGEAVRSGSPDTESETALAQRDLLANAGAIIASELRKAQRQKVLNDYRSGTVSAGDLLQAARSARSQVQSS
jgi:DNA primase